MSALSTTLVEANLNPKGPNGVRAPPAGVTRCSKSFFGKRAPHMCPSTGHAKLGPIKGVGQDGSDRHSSLKSEAEWPIAVAGR